jgi:hypothetical protein
MYAAPIEKKERKERRETNERTENEPRSRQSKSKIDDDEWDLESIIQERPGGTKVASWFKGVAEALVKKMEDEEFSSDDEF